MNRGERPVGVAGAGSIGCFVGGALAAAGRRVALLARPRVIGEIRDNGLWLTNFDGSEQRLPANQLTVSSDPSILGEAGVVLVTVKSADTAEIADILAQHAPRDAVIVSLQNGVGNVAVLRARLPGRKVLGGMVPFNVISPGDGRFHRSTSGDIVVEQDDRATAASLSVPGLDMRSTDNIEGVQVGDDRVGGAVSEDGHRGALTVEARGVLVDRAQLDQLPHVGFFPEQACDSRSHYMIGLRLEPVDIYA